MSAFIRTSKLVKGQFRYLTHWAHILGCLGWNRVVATEMLTIGPVSGIWAKYQRQDQ